MDAEDVTAASRNKSHKILLADDSPIERAGLARHLRRNGHVVEECQDGRQTIQRLEDANFDLLVHDLEMPDVDGFDVLNYLHDNERSLPVVLVSGMPADAIQLRMEDLSSRQLPALFLKPVNLDQLTQVMDFIFSEDPP